MASHLTQYDPQMLLDLTIPFDERKVEVLDLIVDAMFNYKSDEQTISFANQVLGQFKNLPESWQFVAMILSKSKNLNTKYFALQILENCIQTRWKILPPDEKNGIKQYVTRMTLEHATNENTYKKERHYVNKINETLIQIVKQEWPHNWPNFISEVCESAKSNQALCENNLRLLSLLSEEIFDFGQDTMSSKKVSVLMQQMTGQFREVFDLCMLILYNNISNPQGNNISLVSQTLQCLTHFLKWIPYGYIFETFMYSGTPTTLIDLLLTHFWEPMAFRIHTTKCFNEICNLNLDEEEMEQYKPCIANFFRNYTEKLRDLPEKTFKYNDPTHVMPQMRPIWEQYYSQLPLSLSALLRNHASIAEAPENNPYLISLLFLMVKITEVSDDETFKICLDYWYHLLSKLMGRLQVAYSGLSLNDKYNMVSAPLSNNGGRLSKSVSSFTPTRSMSDDRIRNGSISGNDEDILVEIPLLYEPELILPEILVYKDVLDTLMSFLPSKMAKPQEVYVYFDQESGEVVREYEIDTDEVSLYEQMKSILILITKLRPEQTYKILSGLMLLVVKNSKLELQDNEWNPTSLNRLCYTIGAISGSMPLFYESEFMIFVLKLLLKACKMKSKRPDKAIIASCIMYVIGQYPRFMNSNIDFLVVVMIKLFEFMQETFPGVQDMACETFVKLTSRCKKTIAQHVEDNKLFLDEIIKDQEEITSLLEDHQVLLFFESIGHIISATNILDKPNFISKLLCDYNKNWINIIQNINTQPDISLKNDVYSFILKFVRINTKICLTNGLAYQTQFKSIIRDLLTIYNIYGTHIIDQIQRNGPNSIQYFENKNLILVKREILNFVETYVDKTANEHTQQIDHKFLDQDLSPILLTFIEDYQKNTLHSRDFRVLSLISLLIKHYKESLTSAIPQIFNHIFYPTLDMIKQDFRSYPEHRQHFYGLLKMCVENCFDGLFELEPDKLQNFVESLVWAFKHELPQIADQGLLLTYEFVHKLTRQRPKDLQSFCDQFYYTLIRDILFVLTDRLHRSGFSYQTLTLHLLLQLVEMKVIYNPSLGLEKLSLMRNLVEVFVNSFENVNVKQIEAFVLDLFNYCNDNDVGKFQTHIRDFLISLKEFASIDNDFYEADRQEAFQRSLENEKKNQRNIPKLGSQFDNNYFYS